MKGLTEMTNAQIEQKAKGLPTMELADWFRYLTEERRLLGRGLTDNARPANRKRQIERVLRILAPELNNRQKRMKGF